MEYNSFMKLCDLEIGETRTVIKLETESEITKRLYDIGVNSGARVTMYKKSPWKGSVEIKVRDFYLAIRYSVAEKIFVK